MSHQRLLSSDVLHQIILFLTKEYVGLLKFRTICKDWKEIAEHSLLWLSCELVINCPRRYREEINLVSILAETYEIGIDDQIRCISKFQYRFLVLRNNSIRNSMHRTTQIKKQDNFEVSNQICSKFLVKFRSCHKAWDYYLTWFPVYNYFSKMKEEYTQFTRFLPWILINSIILALSAYLLSSIKDYSDHLSWREIVGFLCIYWNGIFYAWHLMRKLLCQICNNILLFDVDIYRPFYLTSSDITSFVIWDLLIATIFTFVLLQYKLSAHTPSFRYAMIPLPLWFFQFINLLIVIYNANTISERIKFIFALFFLSSIPLSATLIGLHYDSPDYVGVSYALVALIPWEIFLGYCTIASLQSTILLWKNYCKNEEITITLPPLDQILPTYYEQLSCLSRPIVRLLMNAFKTISLIMIFLIVFNLNYQGSQNSLSLAMGIVSMVLLFLLLPISFYCYKSDNTFVG